jgi:hypothetical protein
MAKKERAVINQSIGEITWPFSDGRSQTLHLERLSPEVKAYAVYHGLKQKGSDAMALPAEKFPGNRVPESAKWDALKAVIDHLESGSLNWNPDRLASGPSVSGVKFLLDALCELYAGKKTREQLVEFLKSKSREEQLALAENAKIKPIIERMTAAAVAHIDTSAMLDGLDDSDNE